SGVAEISKADFEASIERRIDFAIPYDVKAASNAAKLGQVFVDANRSSKATAAIKQVAVRIMGASEEDLEGAALNDEKKSLLGGFDLKGLLAKKDKEPEAAE
ncbi:MAG: pilus assembly protein CpaE, partial [Pseudomonadota bacterium]